MLAARIRSLAGRCRGAPTAAGRATAGALRLCSSSNVPDSARDAEEAERRMLEQPLSLSELGLDASFGWRAPPEENAKNSLAATVRHELGTNAARKLRATGRVPALLRGRGELERFSLDIDDVRRELRTPGFLSRKFDVVLQDHDGSKRELVAQPCEVQFHPVTDDPIHIRFRPVADSA